MTSSSGKISKLLALSEREFRKQRAAPVRRKFKPRRLDLSKLDGEWDKRRGAAVRMMAIVLGDDSQALYQRVTVDQATREAFGEAITWFKREATYLRKTAILFDTAISRLAAVLSREEVPPATAITSETAAVGN